MHFEQGAQCEHVAQGGEALLTWADALSTLERDPQAPAAVSAKVRLRFASQM